MLLARQRLGCCHELKMPIEPIGLAGNEVAAVNQLPDTLDHRLAFEPPDLEAQRGGKDRMRTERRLAFGEVPDRRGGGMLRLDRLCRKKQRRRS